MGSCLNCPDKCDNHSLFRLKIFLLVILQKNGWSTGVAGSMGPERGPWTGSIGVVHGPGVHVLYTSQNLGKPKSTGKR